MRGEEKRKIRASDVSLSRLGALRAQLFHDRARFDGRIPVFGDSSVGDPEHVHSRRRVTVPGSIRIRQLELLHLHDEVALGDHRHKVAAESRRDRPVLETREPGSRAVAAARRIRVVLDEVFAQVELDQLFAAGVVEVSPGVEDEAFVARERRLLCREQ